MQEIAAYASPCFQLLSNPQTVDVSCFKFHAFGQGYGVSEVRQVHTKAVNEGYSNCFHQKQLPLGPHLKDDMNCTFG